MPAFEATRFIVYCIHQLEAESATFRDLMATLAATRGLTLLLAPMTEFSRAEKIIGRTVFRPSAGGFSAWIDILVDRVRPDLTMEGVAHEFAHVTEAACMGEFRSMADLQSRLRRRAARFRSKGATSEYETPFPNALGKEILREWQTRKIADSQFDALVSRFGLTGCVSNRVIVQR
jgi:hypothetical protein